MMALVNSNNKGAETMQIIKVKNTHLPEKAKLLKVENVTAYVELADNIIETIVTDELNNATTIYEYDTIQLRVSNRDNVIQHVLDNFNAYWQVALNQEPIIKENSKETIIRLEKEKALLEEEVRLLEAEVDALTGV